MSNGEGAHYSHLEIGRKVMNSLTRVAKDTLVIEIYEYSDIRPIEESQGTAHYGGCEQYDTCNDV